MAEVAVHTNPVKGKKRRRKTTKRKPVAKKNPTRRRKVTRRRPTPKVQAPKRRRRRVTSATTTRRRKSKKRGAQNMDMHVQRSRSGRRRTTTVKYVRRNPTRRRGGGLGKAGETVSLVAYSLLGFVIMRILGDGIKMLTTQFTSGATARFLTSGLQILALWALHFYAKRIPKFAGIVQGLTIGGGTAVGLQLAGSLTSLVKGPDCDNNIACAALTSIFPDLYSGSIGRRTDAAGYIVDDSHGFIVDNAAGADINALAKDVAKQMLGAGSAAGLITAGMIDPNQVTLTAGYIVDEANGFIVDAANGCCCRMNDATGEMEIVGEGKYYYAPEAGRKLYEAAGLFTGAYSPEDDSDAAGFMLEDGSSGAVEYY